MSVAKAIIIYESRWGNTKLVGEKIAEGMRQVKGTETTVVDVKDLESAQLAGFELILIGSPNHMGGATRNIGTLIGKLGELPVNGKKAAAFDTCMKNDYEKTENKLEHLIAQKAPGIKVLTPGLSIIVNGFKGPAQPEELSKAIEFGKKIAGRIKSG
jgi:flavodoxin